MNRIKLGEIAVSQTGPFGSQLHEEDYVEKGTPIVSVEHLGEVGFTRQNLPYVSDKDVKRLKKYTLKEGDIVFSRVGSIDKNTYTTKNEEGWLFSGRCLRVRCDKTKVDPLYLSYYFKLPEFKKMMLNISVGATMPSLNTDLMNNLPLNLVDIDKQHKIAKLLNSFDDRIRVNNLINSNLESLAKTIYDYWFLQFEFPNDEGKPYKSSGGKMVWNDELKREIPEGWEAKQIKDIVTTNRGISYTAKDLADIGTPILSLASVSRTGEYIPEGIKYFYGEVPSSKELKPYDLIMCNTDMTQQREVIARCIMVPDIFENVITHTHHITKVSLNDDSYNSYFCSTTQSSWFHEYVKGFSSGTNVLGLDAKAFDKIWLPVPDKNTAEKYNKTFMKLQKDKSNLLKQNQELASLRDFLLPMLMNGQITFKDN